MLCARYKRCAVAALCCVVLDITPRLAASTPRLENAAIEFDGLRGLRNASIEFEQLRGIRSATIEFEVPFCGDGIIEGAEECEVGLGCSDCLCDAGFQPTVPPSRDCAVAIPTVSEWGLIVMTALALMAGTIMFGRRRRELIADR